jgi:hypothetical protein
MSFTGSLVVLTALAGVPPLSSEASRKPTVPAIARGANLFSMSAPCVRC